MTSDSFYFYWVFEGCFNQRDCSFNNASQIAATPGLLKKAVFWKKCYDFMISVQDLTNKILLRGPNCIVDVFM